MNGALAMEPRSSYTWGVLPAFRLERAHIARKDMEVLPSGPLEPAGASATEYEPLTREERGGERRLCPWVPIPLAVVDPVMRLARVSRDDFVVDLGCGNGEVCSRFSA